MTKRTYTCAMLTAGLALLALIIQQLICSRNGTILRPANIITSLILIVICFAACLYCLSKYNHITWQNTAVLIVACSLVIVFRCVLYIDEVAFRLGVSNYITMIILYMALQLVVGLTWIGMLRPKEKPGETAPQEKVTQDNPRADEP